MVIKDIDKVERYIKRELGKFKNSHVEVGIRDNELASDGSSILLYATANEFGAKIPNASGGVTVIPERSFMRSTIKEKMGEWMNEVTSSVADILDLHAANAKIALSRIGLIATGDIKDKITSNIRPDNAPSTKKKKTGSTTGITTTLIDTGAMRAAVNYRVVGKNGVI